MAKLSGDHASSPGATFSFAYTSTEVNIFATTAAAKQYMTEATGNMASCTSYYYGTDIDDRYVPQRAFSAPKAGDQSALLIATLAFSSGNSRDDVFSVVRTGQLISVEMLQLSKPLTEPQLDQVARAQAKRLSDVLRTSPKKSTKG